MDLRLFHPVDSPDRNYKMKDRLNSWTRLLPCRFLEWAGWYNYSVAQRLLGHYRLFQHFRIEHERYKEDLPPARSYILHYKTTHVFKYFLSRVMAMFYSIFTRKENYPVARLAALNRMLVNESSAILEEFLNDADTDFAKALKAAIGRISEPSFFEATGNKANNYSLSIHTAHNQLNDYSDHSNRTFDLSTHTQNDYSDHSTNSLSLDTINNNSLNHFITNRAPQMNPQPASTSGALGKEKGILSKHQVLIFFDLLYETEALEQLEFGQSAHELKGKARFLHALTGKTKKSWIKELNNYKKTNLYETHTSTQTDNLINTIRNLSEICGEGGFRSLAILAVRKIDDLEDRRVAQLRQAHAKKLADKGREAQK